MQVTHNALPINDKREIFGWTMYDWANSAFSTTVGTVFLGPYLASLAANASIKSPDGMARFLGLPIAPDSFLPYAVSVSVGLQVLFLPMLGAIADFSYLRKQMMRIFATMGALATIGLFSVTEPLWWLGGVLFVLANLCFGAASVFYNAYLPDIASEDQRDRVSSYGFAMGYLGGGLLLMFNLIFYQLHEHLGVPTGLTIRINLASAGLWWMGFSLITWARVRSHHTSRQLAGHNTYLKIGLRQLINTLKELRHHPQTIRYLLAYLLYNDGIQTAIAVTATFAAAPIVRGGLEIDQGTLTMVILMIQFVAFGGALIWGRLSGWVGAKTSIVVSLVIWSTVVIYAYSGLHGDTRVLEFWILGAIIAMVLGGSQAISRSLFAQMIPHGQEAKYYSFYAICERGTSWIGPLAFGLINQVFGSLRPAILSLIFFFVVGLMILLTVNVPRAISEASKSVAATKGNHTL